MGILSALFGKKKDGEGQAPPDDGGIKPANQDAISRDQGAGAGADGTGAFRAAWPARRR
ncbi:MAG: hypothetical protein U5Q44_12910 [Dehalococcoidia bacterium]|nr:hypothetical protein [Dehalococcoidia bacterium]